jgi:hypothetical protein
MGDRLAQLGYEAARRLLLIAGIGVLLVVIAVMYIRSVDTVEVVAAMLFVPIFIALLYKGVLGGLIAGIAASIVYALLRAPAIDAIGFGEFAGLIASRSAAYLIFGVFGGWCSQTLESSLDKLELYDEVDDDTGLGNARLFLRQTDLEAARAKRYQTLFSVVRLEVAASAFAGLGRRRSRSALRELGRLVREGVRTVDHVAHGRFGDRHLFAAVLPETAAEGAAIFRDRFASRIGEFLGSRGAVVGAADIVASSFTIPGNEEMLEAARADFGRIDEHEHATRS